MTFDVNFLTNTAVKDFENRPTFATVTNECIVAQFFLTRCVHVGGKLRKFLRNVEEIPRKSVLERIRKICVLIQNETQND